MRTISTGIALCLCLAFIGQASHAQRETANLNQRLNIAGKQRMLSQRMAKATCFALIGINTKAHRIEAAQAVTEFKTALDLLQYGSVPLGLPPETDTTILEKLAVGRAIWNMYGPAIQQINANDIHNVILSQMVNLNMELSASMDAIVREISDKASKTNEKNPLFSHQRHCRAAKDV